MPGSWPVPRQHNGCADVGQVRAGLLGGVPHAGLAQATLAGLALRLYQLGLDPGAMDAVARWTDRRREYGIRGGPLFCTLAGGPVSAGYVRDMLKRLKARAGLEKRVHPHGLRHTHAAELVREGVPINVIGDQLGHSSLAVTDRYLRDVAPADVIALGKSRTWTEGAR
jgi:integrase